MFGRQKVATLVAEFLGTGVLTLLILSVQRSTIGVPFFVAMTAGLTLALMVFVLSNKHSANLNPAVTIGLWTARKIPTLTAIAYVAVQLLGAWAAYYLYIYFVRNSLQPIGGHFAARVLVAEATGTAILTFGWAAAIYRKANAVGIAATAGLAYMIGIIAASPAAIGLLNPAVSLGVRAWVWGTYVLGPVIGGIIGVNLYALLFTESGGALGEALANANKSNGKSKK